MIDCVFGWRKPGGNHRMIIKSSDQVPRATLLKRFPIPRNFGVTQHSRVARGKTWPAPAGAIGVKTFEIYRYTPDSGENPRLDTFEVDLDNCGPMVLDALIWIKNKVDSTLTFRRSCREGICGSCAMNIDDTNWLACTWSFPIWPRRRRFIRWRTCGSLRILSPNSRISSRNMLRSSLGSKPRPPSPNGRGSNRRRHDAKLTATTNASFCFCCTSGCPSHWWNGDRFFGPAVLLQAWRWLTDSRDEAKEERLDNLEDPFRLYRCHTIPNCTRTWGFRELGA